MMMKPTTRRTVSFGANTEKAYPDLELTDEERTAVWYTTNDLVDFRMHALELTDATANRGSALSSSSEESLRGLESYTSKDKTRKRRQYIRYVLSLQAQNRSIGIDDPLGLRACAVARSNSSMEWALIRASKDATEARVQDEEDSCSSSSSCGSNYKERRQLYAREAEDNNNKSNVNKHPNIKRGSNTTIYEPRKNKTTATVA